MKKRCMFSLFCASLLCLQQATSFAFLASSHHRLIRVPMARFAEEKKDDGVLYWEAGLSDVELPSFSTSPKMIVFDKDGTLGDDAASLKRWTNHMTSRFKEALQSELHLPQADIESHVKTLHDLLGWDASVGHVIPSASLAAGTWEEAVETCSTLFQSLGLSPHTAKEWHGQLKHVHGADPPVIPNLCGMLQSCRDDFGMIVAVCTSDDRAPTNASLKNWNVTNLIDLSICGDEVMEAKPSAMPLELLCEKVSLTPKDCIVVGDTTGDTGMARNAQAGLCIGVLSGSGTADQLMETGANIILPNVGDIPALLECMGIQTKPEFVAELIDEEPSIEEPVRNVTVIKAVS